MTELVKDLTGPHWDAEWDEFRGNFRYWLTVPEQGVDAQTGVVMFIPAYGMEGNGAYAQKFRTYIANRYNCLVASIVSKENYTEPRFRLAPDFWENLERHHQMQVVSRNGLSSDSEQLWMVLKTLNDRGVRKLNPACGLYYDNQEYFSFGVIPAMNALHVLHDILGSYPVDKRRLYCLGSSYGGYVASMLLKFAPNTFRMLVDNSGFVNADDLIVYHFDGRSLGGVEQIAFEFECTLHWSDDPASPRYFSPARKQIRDLLQPGHVRASESMLIAYHSVQDQYIDIGKKLALNALYRDKVPYHQVIVDPSGIDGRIFKTLEHGMGASLRSLFEMSYEHYGARGVPAADTTDFDLGSVIELPCGEQTYLVCFDADGVELVIQ